MPGRISRRRGVRAGTICLIHADPGCAAHGRRQPEGMKPHSCI